LDDTQLTWLEAVAEYRATHHITTRDPLGPIPVDDADLEEFDQLLHQICDIRDGLVLVERDDLGIDL
jgi:hypothetical protein